MGASWSEGIASFCVWAPLAERVELHLVAPEDRVLTMHAGEFGYHTLQVRDVPPGSRYFLRLNGERDVPDPASRFQPLGVHGPSQVLARHEYPTEWQPRPLAEYVLYELHVGTFTPEGTLEAIIPHLDRLRDLGVTAVELLPVAAFPGRRNWGYDGVFPYAVHEAYGGPDALRRLARACHERQMALVLDVVYNHLGPEGNYLREFGPYFTDRYCTPWGEPLNFDGPDSDPVRRFFAENALYWLEECGVDALRLDAVHAIMDRSAAPFLQELAEQCHRRAAELGRTLHLIAESDLNDARLVTSPAVGGYGLDGQWCDEFHHALRTLITRESAGYYSDFGRVSHFADAFRHGWVYRGQYAPHRKRRFGNATEAVQGSQLVVFTQNHDQVGNRMLGDRLEHLAGPAAARCAAAAMILSPFLPLIFMGEEYAEPNPFQYFVSHTDEALAEAVRTGRRREFAAFLHQGEPPDPQSEITHRNSTLQHELASQDGRHNRMHEWYRALLTARREQPALALLDKGRVCTAAYEEERVLVVWRWHEQAPALLVFSFHNESRTVRVDPGPGHWRKLLDGADEQWGGPGVSLPDRLTEPADLTLPPFGCALFVREGQ